MVKLKLPIKFSLISLRNMYIIDQKNWHKTFDRILWACQTSPKESINSTPFRLALGHDAVLPMKIYV